MIRLVKDAGLYAFALAGGEFGVLYPGSHVSTSEGRVELPGEDVLFLVGTLFDGRLCMAGQGQDSGYAWLYDRTWRHLVQTALDTHDTFGVSPCAFGAGSLFVATSGYSYDTINLASGTVESHMADVGTQGFRYVEENGTPVTGDATYRDGELFEYTVRGDVRIGQGHEGGAIVEWDARRELEPGDCRFIRFDRTGDQLAVAIVQLPQHRAVLHWLNVGDIQTLPLVTPPIDVPPIDPPEPPVSTPVPDYSQFFRDFLGPRLRIVGDLQQTRERTFAAVNAAVREKAKTDPRCGVLLKEGGDRVLDRAADIHLYKISDTEAQVIDVVGNGEGAPDPGQTERKPPVPGWSLKDIRPISQWREPYPDLPDPLGGTPTEPGTPTPISSALIDISKLVAEIAALKAADAANAARIKALEDRPSVPPPALGGRFALRTDNGHYLCAENGGGGEVNATRQSVGGWETYTLEPQ